MICSLARLEAPFPGVPAGLPMGERGILEQLSLESRLMAAMEKVMHEGTIPGFYDGQFALFWEITLDRSLDSYSPIHDLLVKIANDRDYQYILFQTNFQRIWRYSGNSDYYYYSLEDKSMRLIVEGAFTAEVSPDGRQVGYGKEGNLYVFDLRSGEHTQLTFDGADKFYNGRFGWANEEGVPLNCVQHKDR